MTVMRTRPEVEMVAILFLLQTSFVAFCSPTSDIWWNLGLHGPELFQYNAATRLFLLSSSSSGNHDNNAGLQVSAFCSSLRGLSPGQLRLCQLYEDHMPSVGRGVRLAVAECQRQFADRRWNCSTRGAASAADAAQTTHSHRVANVTSSAVSLFGPITDIASRETAFTYAILASGVVHSISRSCRDGELTSCGCSQRGRPAALQRDWVWGGCGDNVDYGYKFAVGFIDTREREKNFPRRSAQLAKMLMNLHNNEAGRRAVYKYVRAACKCHGVSGSCSVKTCWTQLPSFQESGSRLMDRYDAASEVTFNRQGTSLTPVHRRFNKPGKEDLVFVDSSPDYCQADQRIGSLGTSGRQCDRTSPGIEGCGLMCCGRGYNVQRTRLVERCQCKFQWCCYVKCKSCERIANLHTCK